MSTSPARDRTLLDEVIVLGECEGYYVAAWRSVTLIRVTGDLDDTFLSIAKRAHDAALGYDPNGYASITIAELSAKLPSQKLRSEASRLRRDTQADLRAQAVILAGEGFFASAMRAALLGILSMAKSRVPITMTSTPREAAEFIVRHIPNGRFDVTDLERVIDLARGV
jgi:hypothetical protein